MTRLIFFLLNAAEHEIRPANNSQNANNCEYFLLNTAELETFSANNIVGIFIFISRENFMIS